jgi:hypothetical protein
MKSKTASAKSKAAAKRKILVILSNRWAKLEKPRYFEIEADSKGNIHSERRLRTEPREAVFDEVWETMRQKARSPHRPAFIARPVTSCRRRAKPSA